MIHPTSTVALSTMGTQSTYRLEEYNSIIRGSKIDREAGKTLGMCRVGISLEWAIQIASTANFWFACSAGDTDNAVVYYAYYDSNRLSQRNTAQPFAQQERYTAAICLKEENQDGRTRTYRPTLKTHLLQGLGQDQAGIRQEHDLPRLNLLARHSNTSHVNQNSSVKNTKPSTKIHHGSSERMPQIPTK